MLPDGERDVAVLPAFREIRKLFSLDVERVPRVYSSISSSRSMTSGFAKKSIHSRFFGGGWCGKN
jgi:hypothetical protein